MQTYYTDHCPLKKACTEFSQGNYNKYFVLKNETLKHVDVR